MRAPSTKFSKDGTVEVEGTHAELLQQRGRYAELFELQAAGYR